MGSSGGAMRIERRTVCVRDEEMELGDMIA
jgi:hypothetical protein